MPQAYRTISWNSVVLIAAMIPIGIALQESGGAELIATELVNRVGGTSPLLLLAVIFVVTTALSQVVSNSATTILMVPIVLQVGLDLSISARPLLMIVAISASTAFLTPIGTSTNLMVAVPGAYNFKDFLRVGSPLIFLFLLLSLILVPIIWPL